MIEKTGAEHQNFKNIQLKKVEKAVEEVKKQEVKKEVVFEKGSAVSELRNIFDSAARQKNTADNLKKVDHALSKAKSLAKEVDNKLEQIVESPVSTEPTATIEH
jgi:hypothetical protein